MKKVTFRIIKRIDGNDKVVYFAKRKHFFLGLEYWKNVTQYKHSYDGGCYETIFFTDEDHAIDYIETQILPSIRERIVEYEMVSEKTYSI